MSIKVIFVGKIKNKNLENEILELSKRISRFEIIYLKEIKEKNLNLLKKKEFEEIKLKIDKNSYTCLLLEEGEIFSTKNFYEFCKNKDFNLTFIITGPFGPNQDLIQFVDKTISLSLMTFTSHQALYLLIEQIYRVDCYEKNIPYTK